MISCNDAVRQLWEYLDGAVGVEDRELMEQHLAFCRRCCGEVAFAEELRTFLAEQPSEELPYDVRARLLSTLDVLEERG